MTDMDSMDNTTNPLKLRALNKQTNKGHKTQTHKKRVRIPVQVKVKVVTRSGYFSPVRVVNGGEIWIHTSDNTFVAFKTMI